MTAPITAPLPSEGELFAAAVGPILEARLLAASRRARVFDVTLLDSTRRVIKVIQSSRLPEVTGRLDALAGVNGLSPCLSRGELGQLGYLVHPWHPNTLADLIRSAPLTPAAAVALLGPVATAIEAMHAGGWVHADIKPANIHLTTDGRAVLADIDDAVLIGARPTRMTPGFSAPEAVTGSPISPAADYYGFARTLGAALGVDQLLAGVDQLQGAFADLAADCSPDPSARVFTPTQLLATLAAGGGGGVAGAAVAVDPLTWQANLSAAARSVFGEVDLDAVTRDRLELQSAGPDSRTELDPRARSVWRSPTMLAALAAAAVLVVLAVVLTVARVG